MKLIQCNKCKYYSSVNKFCVKHELHHVYALMCEFFTDRKFYIDNKKENYSIPD